MGRGWIILFLTAAFFIGASIVAAQDRVTGGGQVALFEAQATERSNKGKLDGCEITYTVAFEDNIYRNGGLSLLRGSVSIIGFIEAKDKPPAILLKATAFDMINEQPKLSPLGYAYLSAGGQSCAGSEYVKFACEDGGLCVGYQMLNAPTLGAALGHQFQINITRANGSSDVSIPIFLLRDKPDVSKSFASCYIKLLNALKQKFSEQISPGKAA